MRSDKNQAQRVWVARTWINFEAGALSREIETSLVTPFLFDLREAEIEGPLKQFQVVINEKSDIPRLLTSINNKQGENRLEETNLQATFEMWWPKLNDKLKGIQQEVGKTPARQTRDTSEMVEELLELARMQHREMTAFVDRNTNIDEIYFMDQMGKLEQLATTLSALTRSVEALHGHFGGLQYVDLDELSPPNQPLIVKGSPFQPPQATKGQVASRPPEGVPPEKKK